MPIGFGVVFSPVLAFNILQFETCPLCTWKYVLVGPRSYARKEIFQTHIGQIALHREFPKSDSFQGLCWYMFEGGLGKPAHIRFQKYGRVGEVGFLTCEYGRTPHHKKAQVLSWNGTFRSLQNIPEPFRNLYTARLLNPPEPMRRDPLLSY